ncbi:MAG: copper resistance protein CopC [Rhodanobacteraceae bacterium]|nr:MAG: copper resistance protein CopC [Rhodanobacteraceae bacterium]
MRILACTLVFLLACAAAPAASAHAFPDRSSPEVGATVAKAPQQVKVWFDGELEPVFSTLIVKNASGKQVSPSKGQVDANDHSLLETGLPAMLPPGKYEVYWSVVAHDGHRTAGHFAFTVR